jgi:TonB family protein
MRPADLALFFALGALAVGSSALAQEKSQERTVVAGQEGVPAPKRTKTVQPVYPPEALAQGIRGIVILELLIDPQGKVVSAEVVRSIPGLDEAALEAVRNWEYEITKVEGKAVSVKLTVPITFAMKLPEVTRAPGIPELRQGVPIPFPSGQSEGASVTAEVTLAPDGQVEEAEVVEGSAPWTTALLAALRTWRFASEGDNVQLSFRVEADFVPGRGDQRPRVEVRLSGLRRSEALAPAAAPAPEPAPGPEPAAAPPAPTTPATTPPGEPAPSPPAAPEPAAPTPEEAPAPTPAPAAPPASVPPGPPEPPSAPPTTAPGPEASSSPPAEAPGPTTSKPAPTAPPVEVITAPRPPGAERPLPAQPGVSAVRDVGLALGVPDLVQGRRPVPPPRARMDGTTGTVEVKFGVDAAGVTSVTEANGPDVLRTAAVYTVQSWLFRRVTAERLHLLAVFEFAGETAKASVKLEP